MWRKILKSILIIILAAGSILGLFFAINYYLYTQQPVKAPDFSFNPGTDLDLDPPSPSEIDQHIVDPDKPRFMSITKIGIFNARVVELGTVGANRQLDDPKNIHDVGWYHGSAKPGQPSTETPAGLYDGHNTGAYVQGVFFNLGRLTYDDQIIIERGDRARLIYAVRESLLVPFQEVNMNVMMQTVTPGAEGLNIITCGGSWDEAAQNYTHRVLIRAILLSS